MAEALGVLLYGYFAQLVIGLVVIGTVLFRKLRLRTFEPGWRVLVVWIALFFFAVSIVADGTFLFAPSITLQLARQVAVIGVSALCLAFVFGLIGKGPGRVLIPITSALFALPWLPFIFG